MNANELKILVRQYAGESLLPWEEHYLEIHAPRYRDTISLWGPGPGKRLLDVGAFPGHITLLAHHFGYQVDTRELGLVVRGLTIY